MNAKQTRYRFRRSEAEPRLGIAASFLPKVQLEELCPPAMRHLPKSRFEVLQELGGHIRKRK